MSSIKHALIAAGVGFAVSAHAEPVGAKLSIDDIDQLARASVVRSLGEPRPRRGCCRPAQ